MDSAALETVSGDLGAIVNCTRENDVVLLDVEGEIRMPARVVRWNLTLSSYVTSTGLIDGTFPEAVGTNIQGILVVCILHSQSTSMSLVDLSKKSFIS